MNSAITNPLRHHPGESVFRVLFTVLGILVAGLPMGVVMFYQSLSGIFAQITHANIKIPEKLDRLLSCFLVTPKHA